MPPKSIDSKLNEHHGNSSNMLSEESMEFIHKTNQLVVQHNNFSFNNYPQIDDNILKSPGKLSTYSSPSLTDTTDEYIE
jgi:hypothetical protein